MPELINIQKVLIGPKHLLATLSFAPGGPVMTNANPQATERVKWLVPEIMRHDCTEGTTTKFATSLSRTEIAHLVEHVTLELMALTNCSVRITSGRTRRVADHLYEVEIACPDDVLTTASLASAVFIVNWAFQAKDNKGAPNVEAIVKGIQRLVFDAKELEDQMAAQKEAEKTAEESHAEGAEHAGGTSDVEDTQGPQSAVGEPTPRSVQVEDTQGPQSAVGEPTPRSAQTTEASSTLPASAGKPLAQEQETLRKDEQSHEQNQTSQEINREEKREDFSNQGKEQKDGGIHLGTTVGFMSPRGPQQDEDLQS